MSIQDLLKIPTVQAFLVDGSVMTVFEAILEKFALPKDRAIELLDLTDAALDGTITVDAFPDLLAQAFGAEPERAKRMACDVVGFRLLPLEEYVPGVAAQITAWGGDLSKYPKSRVGKTKMNAETFASQLDEKLELNFSEVLIKRCAYLLAAYWNKEKTKESTVTFFSRATTIGGLGLSPDLAQKLLAEIDGSRDMIDIVDSATVVNTGEEAVKEIEEQFAKSEAEVPPPYEGGGKGEVSHELTSELPIINAPTKPVPTSHIDDSWKGELKEAEKKAKQVVSVESLRNVGDKVSVQSVADAPKNNILDRRFAALTKDSSSEHLEPILPEARVSLARSAKEESAQQSQAISEEKLVDAAIASRPAPVKPMLTVGSVVPQNSGKPMTDIQPVKRLVGPIDELGGMTAVEFRRLSSVPADAAQKIEDILSTLESQSYEDRVKGVKAWRQSPMNQLYVAMTTQALLQGVGLAEIATRKRSAGEESLSPAEIRAVSALNERLRF